MKTTIISAIAMSAALVGGSVGCVKNSSYAIRPLEHEVKAASLDGTWFERAVWDKGEIVAVELVYCPMMPNVRTVCRTAVVWRKNSSVLVDAAEASAPAAPPGTVPVR